MTLRSKTTIALAVCLAAAFSSVALGAGEGTALGVSPDAMARLQSEERILQAGADVSVGELIITGPTGQVQILFDDETRLVVGPNSSLKIETYLLASTNIAQQLTINALGGSFRFISGNSPKPAYSIHTPTASIAVRGTKFDIIVGSLGTGVLLYDGALQLCAGSASCTEVTQRCDIGTAVAGSAAVVGRISQEHHPLALKFRYARFQVSLLHQFRIAGVGNCLTDPVQAPVETTTSRDESGGRLPPPEPTPDPPTVPPPDPPPVSTPDPPPVSTPDPPPVPTPTPEPVPTPNPAPTPTPQQQPEPAPPRPSPPEPPVDPKFDDGCGRLQCP